MAIVALTIGLSVGLTQKKEKNSTTENAATVSTSIPTGSTSTGTSSTTTSTESTTTGTASTTPPMDSNTTDIALNTPANDLNNTGTVSTSKVYTTSTGSMNVTLKLFNPNITIPYADDDELKADLTEAAKLVVINVIKSYTDQKFSGYGLYDDNNVNVTDDFIVSEGENVSPTNITTTSTRGKVGQFATQGSNKVPILRYVSRCLDEKNGLDKQQCHVHI